MTIISNIARTLRDSAAADLTSALSAVFLSASAADLAEFYDFTVNVLIGYSTGDRRAVMAGACEASRTVRKATYALKVDGRAWSRDMERYFWITRIDCACYIPDHFDPSITLASVREMNLADTLRYERECRAEEAA